MKVSQRVSELDSNSRLTLGWLQFTKGHNSVKTVNGVMVLNLCTSGLEKLTNANRSVSSKNYRLFPVELTEIADWKSMSE